MPLTPQPYQRLHPINLILPLCTSAATLGLSIFQYPLFNSFLAAPPRAPRPKPTNKRTQDTTAVKISGAPLSSFWQTFLVPSASLIAGICLASTTSGLLPAHGLRCLATPESRAMSAWFSCGAALALGHLAFVPAVAGPIRTIVNCRAESEGEVGERNESAMRAWLWWHTVRTVLVDAPSLFCLARGVGLGFGGV